MEKSLPPCPYCHHDKVVRNGRRKLQSAGLVQTYRCQGCRRFFSERTGTPMDHLQTPKEVVARALEERSEGLGLRATARLNGVAHRTVSEWEKRVARLGSQLQPALSPPDPGHGGGR
jgi:transposase-like protein